MSDDEVPDPSKLYCELKTAAQSGDAGRCGELLRQGAPLCVAGDGGHTPLVAACKSGHTGVIRALVEAGASVTDVAESRMTPLHLASDRGLEDAIRALVGAGADVNARDVDQQTPLHRASLHGHVATIRVLLEAGADVGAVDIAGRHPLLVASMMGHTEAIRVLVDAGRDMNLADVNGRSALHFASEHGCSTAMSCARRGAPASTSREALYNVVKTGSVAEFRRLMAEGVDARQRHPARGSLLAEAVLSDRADMLAAVLASPARELLSEDVFGAPLIFLALRCNAQLDVVRLLLEAGAPTIAGTVSASLGAAPHPDPRVLALVLDHTGDDVNSCPRGAWSALEGAVDAGRLENVRLLLSRGATPNPAHPFDMTPIMRACDIVLPEATEETIVKIVRLLSEAGCPVHARNASGETALHVAVQRRRANVARALIAMGLSANDDEDGGEQLREEAVGLDIEELYL